MGSVVIDSRAESGAGVQRLSAHEAADIFPMLDAKRHAELREDIRAHGLRQPIVVHEGKILDGRNRYRACVEEGVEPRFVAWEGGDPFAFVWSLNGARRDLTDAQRYLCQRDCAARSTALRAEIERIAAEANAKRSAAARGNDYAAKARRNGAATSGGTTVPEPAPKRPPPARATEAKAAHARVGRGTVERMDALVASRPDLAEKVKAGTVPAARAVRQMRADQAQDEARAAVEALRATAKTEELHRVICGDLRDAMRALDPESVDVIVTDPPYPQEFLPLYGAMAAEAARVLRPGGSLVAMIGQSYMPEILAALGAHLTYQWVTAYLTPGGQAVQLWQRKVNTFWKPVVWYVKGAYEGPWIGDVAKSRVNDNDKRFHGWGQSESGMLDLVERFTKPGQTVLDPFCGAGTTGVVCAASGRRFIGIDLDEAHVEVTRGRIARAMSEAA